MALGCALALAAGCTSATSYGPCLGINGQPDSTLRYEYSERNIIVGVLGVETVVIPIIIAFDELKCPVGYVPVNTHHAVSRPPSTPGVR